jgi:hypothetical protein
VPGGINSSALRRVIALSIAKSRSLHFSFAYPRLGLLQNGDVGAASLQRVRTIYWGRPMRFGKSGKRGSERRESKRGADLILGRKPLFCA